MNYEEQKGDYLFSNDRGRLQVELVHSFLSNESYWAKNISADLVWKTMEGSECFGIYLNGIQIGFARVITDNASFGYLADVFIVPAHRGKGLSKQLIGFIMAYPGFKGFRRFMLATKDAHSLYEKFGFRPLSEPERFMEIRPFETYSN